MLDNVVTEEPRGTFVFERKVNLGDYESATAMASVQFPVNWGNDAETAQNAKDAAFQAKLAVFEQLGIKAEFDSAAGILREVIEKTFGSVTVVPPDTESVGQAQQAPPAANAGPVCPTCKGPMYDNRQRNDQKAAAGQKLGPDWRCKNYKPENGGCPGVIWRPKSGATAGGNG